MQQFCFCSTVFQTTLCINSILWATIMVLKIGVNLTACKMHWKQKHFFQLTLAYCSNKQYLIYVNWCVELFLLLIQFSLFSLLLKHVFCTLCYYLIIKSNLSINLNNLVDRLHYLLISFISCFLSRSTTVLHLSEGCCVIAGEKIASLGLLEKQIHSCTGRNLWHPVSVSVSSLLSL